MSSLLIEELCVTPIFVCVKNNIVEMSAAGWDRAKTVDTFNVQILTQVSNYQDLVKMTSSSQKINIVYFSLQRSLGVNMSYYRYITGVYKSYWPQLNRTLRSSSVPRHVPQVHLDERSARASSVPPSWHYSRSYFIKSTSALPFR